GAKSARIGFGGEGRWVWALTAQPPTDPAAIAWDLLALSESPATKPPARASAEGDETVGGCALVKKDGPIEFLPLLPAVEPVPEPVQPVPAVEPDPAAEPGPNMPGAPDCRMAAVENPATEPCESVELEPRFDPSAVEKGASVESVIALPQETR